MSTLQDLWNEYWWVLPIGLMLLCVLGCILGGRTGQAGCRTCGLRGARPRRTRCC